MNSLMMKCRSAHLKVVHEFNKVCERHNLKWYAFCGTLLGAVRHKGFVPWDDDIDIAMMRSDYNLFLYYAEKELPYFVDTFDSVSGGTVTHNLGITRINNTHEANFDPDFLKDNFEFPYMVGIDLYPLDYVPENYDFFIELYKYIIAVGAKYKLDHWDSFTIHNPVYDDLDLEEGYQTIEKVTGIKIDRSKDILSQLDNIALHVATRPKSDKVACMAHMVMNHKNMIFPKELFKDRFQVPFEDITVYIPSGYEEILRINYNDYSKIDRNSPHEYPYYKDQERQVVKYMMENDVIVPKEYVIDVYDEYKDILDEIYGE